MMINRHNNGKGFTLVELLVALMVTSIILAAVATLAFAMGSVKDSTDDTSSKQAQLRLCDAAAERFDKGLQTCLRGGWRRCGNLEGGRQR